LQETLKQERILVVDDEPSICKMVAKVLKSEGYEPVTCTNPQDALEAVKRDTFGLAFVDIKLPQMSGLHLAPKLKQHNPALEVVFITGYGTLESAVQAIKVGAYDFLRKPFNISELRLCLKRFREREVLKERIRLAEQRYYHLVQHIPLLVFLLRSDFQLEFVNEACLTMLGYTADEALNAPNWLLERVHPDERKRIKELLRSAFSAGGSPFSTECCLLHKKGHPIHVMLKSIPWFQNDMGHEPDRLEGVILDITDRVFLEKTMVQREKLKTLGTVAAEVAHEIRNPLVSIGGFARRLQKKLPDTPEIGIILNDAQRLEEILDRIRNYLEPVDLRPRECFVNSIVTNCVNLLSPEIERKGIKFRLDLNPQLPPVCVDPDILAQVFINLIRNGVETMDRGNVLIIESLESDENLRIIFKNEARGQEIKDPEHLFLPFDEGGPHIGLPFSYRLLKNMGGFLSFAQDEQYTTFTVTLPKSGGDTLRGDA
jgi:PAS domain S-box-containing protein